MTARRKNGFGGGQFIHGDDLANMQVNNAANSVLDVLARHKWDGSPVGCVLLELSADNETVDNGSFFVRGPLADVFRVRASNLWPSAKSNVSLTVRVPTGAAFKFDAGLCSELISSEEIVHNFTVQEEGAEPCPLTAAQLQSHGVGLFCLRLVCHTVKSSAKSGVTMRYTVLIFPGSPEEVLDISELAQSAGWPGWLVAEGDMALFPTPRHLWQCPVLPLLLTGTPWGADPVCPPAALLRTAIARIMSRSVPAETCTSRKTLLARWERYANNPDEFTQKRSPFVWPEPESPAVQTPGEDNLHIFKLIRKR